ncbi:unnamed protein product [Microthlaspi erraticum]|uniref:Uncharacterized protein n=1 Tax=Microthlaspi erraticum TaxID=1685480 RepID=A0A6D2JSF2_9BRAS|nr:unnamed protein product [Microthlaspi erraticum]
MENHLRSKFKRDPWSGEEDQILIEAHRAVGNKWAQISLELPRRSENAVKNHWNVTVRRMFSTNRSYDNILENYIRSITINNDTPNDTSDGNMSLSLDVTPQIDEPSIDASTSSVLEPTTFSWDDYLTNICDSMDFEMVMNEWE